MNRQKRFSAGEARSQMLFVVVVVVVVAAVIRLFRKPDIGPLSNLESLDGPKHISPAALLLQLMARNCMVLNSVLPARWIPLNSVVKVPQSLASAWCTRPLAIRPPELRTCS